jgi:cytochrome c oxidase subunit 2
MIIIFMLITITICGYMKLFGFFSFLLYSNGLLAKGQPTEWQLGFQEAGSPLMQKLIDFHDFVFWIITAITVFVFLLLAYVCVKFSAKNNKKPSTTTHNSLLEVAWTLVPVLILVVIAIPSFRLLYNQNDFSNIDMTIKATGYTWYWSYEYPDHDGIAFDSIMLQDDELEEGQPRLLSTDYQLVVPVNKNIKMQITSDPSGVIHSWAVPSLGVKMDAIPGRLNETYFNVKEPGMYYGQCSELCGIGHGFMPISIRAVTENDFAAWVITAKEEFASNINDKYAIK